MDFERKSVKKSRLYPIIVLERVFPHRFRHRTYSFLLKSTLFFGILTFAFYMFVSNKDFFDGQYTIEFESWLSTITGIALLLFSLWVVVFLLEGFFRSYYFKKIDKEKGDVTFDVLMILYRSRKNDLTKAFLSSYIGKEIMFRCGIGRKNVKEFLKGRTYKKIGWFDTTSINGVFDVDDFAWFLLDKDEEFAKFLFLNGLQKKEFIGAARWVAREEKKKKYKEKWWSKESLSKIKPLGESWSYGYTYLLNKYSKDLLVSTNLFTGEMVYEDKVLQIESTLERQNEANVIIVGKDGVGKMDLVRDFAIKISMGTAPKELRHKRIVLLDTDSLVANTGDKIIFEREVIRLFNEANNAGNIILVLENLPEFILNAETLGSNIMNLIDPYLSSSDIQIIATSKVDEFHQLIEGNLSVMNRFEKIILEEPNENVISHILEDTAIFIESKNHVIFTYPAILETIVGVENYFQDAVMPEKGIDLLTDAAVFVRQKKGNQFVLKEDILEIIKMKTNIPMGSIEKDEKEKLVNLEKILHRRVVGQERAVSAVSSAMRRARAGVRDTKKPIGSFLFVGPTGVGKTETAKALAEVFFGDEGAISRLDMSEYQTNNALVRLIGSFEDGEIGSLSKILKEKPYGVILLDEFEKTNTDVHDLFLQILDEGFFSDMKGKRINARNIIFIATSNAGSDMIWDSVQNGVDVESIEDEFIDEIVKSGRFKPELINRFDGVILFHPLKLEHLKKIAKIMLEKLKKRVLDKGINLIINDELVEYVSSQGYDPKFGARPMVRVIKNKVEQKIADGLISGEYTEGSKIEFHAGDFN